MKSCIHGDYEETCAWCIVARQGKEIIELKAIIEVLAMPGCLLYTSNEGKRCIKMNDGSVRIIP